MLAMETSSKVSSVAVVDDKKFQVLSEITTESRLTHSKTLVPHIDDALKLARKERSDLTAVAVSIGPGSFTGLRIGLAAAKAVAYALNIPIFGVPTLKALAYHFELPNIKIICTMDAQKNMVYRESYRFLDVGEYTDDTLQVEDELAAISIENVTEEILSNGEDTVLLGEYAAKIFHSLKDSHRSNVYLAPFHALMPRASLVARRALLQKPDNVMNLEPLYVRRSEAEELWEKRHGKN